MNTQQTERKSIHDRMVEIAKLATKPDHGRYECRECLDRGLIEVWHPKTTPQRKLFCNTACSCYAGKHFREVRPTWKVLPVFDPKVWCRAVSYQFDELIAWINRPAEQHSGFHHEFAEFAEHQESSIYDKERL